MVSTKKVESSRQTGHQKAVKEGFSVKLAMPGVMNLAGPDCLARRVGFELTVDFVADQ